MAISYDSQDDVKENQGVHPIQEYTLEELLECDRDQLNLLSVPRLVHTPPYIVASFLNRLEINERRTVLRSLPEEPASEILAEMDPDLSAETMEEMRESRAIQILEDLDPDDAADVVEEMDADSRNRLLDKLTPQTAAKVKSLLSYSKDTAGGVMNPNVATVRIDMTVDQAIQSIREQPEEAATAYYVYVVDNERKLQGVLNMRDLILAKPNQPISDITETSLKGVCLANDDKEAVALTMAAHNLMALPVIDQEHHLLGVITHDDVIDILQAEATEDIQRLVGAGPDETLFDDISYSITRRIPWLVVNLMTSVLSAAVIYHFRGTIEHHILLAVLMGIVASLGGNTGAQTLAVSIRSLALNEIQVGEQLTICLREFFKGLCNGTILGIVAASVGYLITNELRLSLVLFLACMLNMGVAGLAGSSIPLLLKRFHFDPAQSSSIFLTAITDLAGFTLILGLGSWLIL